MHGLAKTEQTAECPKTKTIVRVEIDPERCKGCGLCAWACRHEHIEPGNEMNSRGHRVFCYVESDTPCTGCRRCALVCPDVAIRIVILRPTTEEPGA